MSVCMCAKIFNLLEYFNSSRAIIQASLEDRLGKKFFFTLVDSRFCFPKDIFSA